MKFLRHLELLLQIINSGGSKLKVKYKYFANFIRSVEAESVNFNRVLSLIFGKLKVFSGTIRSDVLRECQENLSCRYTIRDITAIHKEIKREWKEITKSNNSQRYMTLEDIKSSWDILKLIGNLIILTKRVGEIALPVIITSTARCQIEKFIVILVRTLSKYKNIYNEDQGGVTIRLFARKNNGNVVIRDIQENIMTSFMSSASDSFLGTNITYFRKKLGLDLGADLKEDIQAEDVSFGLMFLEQVIHVEEEHICELVRSCHDLIQGRSGREASREEIKNRNVSRSSLYPIPDAPPNYQ